MDFTSNDIEDYRQSTSTPTHSSCVLDDWNITEVTCPAWLDDSDSESESGDTLLLTRIRDDSTMNYSFSDEVCDELSSCYFDDSDDAYDLPSDDDEEVSPVEEDDSFALCTCDFCTNNPTCSKAHHNSGSEQMQ